MDHVWNQSLTIPVTVWLHVGSL